MSFPPERLLAFVPPFEGDMPRAAAMLRTPETYLRNWGFVEVGPTCCGCRGSSLGWMETWRRQRTSFLEALDNDEDIGNRTGVAIVLDNLAAKAGAEGNHLRALRLGGASEAIKEEAGGHAPPPLIDLPDPREAARDALGDTVVVAVWEEGRAMTLEQALAYARQET